MLKSIHGDQPHDRTATVMASLGILEHDIGNAQSSLDYLLKALKAWESLFGTDNPHPSIALVKCNIGRSYFLIENVDAVEEYTRAAIDDQQKIYGRQSPHPDFCKSYLQMAKVLRAEHRLSDAIDQAKLACEAFQQAFPKTSHGSGHADIAEAFETLGTYMLQYHQSAQAIDKLQRRSWSDSGGRPPENSC